mmetsp:Transcript_11033/g.28299  ORF Transcript_11033/g.28299 Transcript_11033/m.28299 type:complete len:786 (+) Transcript_11033:231-2588(+)
MVKGHDSMDPAGGQALKVKLSIGKAPIGSKSDVKKEKKSKKDKKDKKDKGKDKKSKTLAQMMSEQKAAMPPCGDSKAPAMPKLKIRPIISSGSNSKLVPHNETSKHSRGSKSTGMDIEEDSYFRVGDAGESVFDFSRMGIKDDCSRRPMWVTPDARIFLEANSPIYKQATDFLIAIAEPVCRPEFIHEYMITPHSLYAAVSVGLDTQTMIQVLNTLSKVPLHEDIHLFIKASTENYGKVKLVLRENRFFVETSDTKIAKQLQKDSVIQTAQLHSHVESHATDALGVDDSDAVFSIEIDPMQVEHVKQRCLPGGLNLPLLEEYDYQNDSINPDIAIELLPHVRHRPYQEKSLTKLLGNGRSRSGIIVLPCGAGKTLVGVTAAARIRKTCLCLVDSSVAVDQWRHQFLMWTSLSESQITRVTSHQNEPFVTLGDITITTYTMVSFTGKRSAESQRMMDAISDREWGLLLLDEVHVVPAAMFRKVLGIVKSHCKLGLTATLVREDERISDLNFLIGPKIYEANWQDLTRDGHIASVNCAEVWCPMTENFMSQYVRLEGNPKRQLFYAMNPNKFSACQFLIAYHEKRGDKIIVFSDNIFALREYATRLHKYFIYGPTPHSERTDILNKFRNDEIATVFMSKVGDTGIDLPQANVLIQISSHAGSRRQEAQRLGRILRAKKAAPGEKPDNTAFFYTLVSKDTQEMFYSTKRQQFLVDQGYNFRVITDLLDNADRSALIMSDPAEQAASLQKVLKAEETGEEILNDADDIAKLRNKKKKEHKHILFRRRYK